MLQFNDLMTKDESQAQFLLHIVEQHQQAYTNFVTFLPDDTIVSFLNMFVSISVAQNRVSAFLLIHLLCVSAF